MTTLRARVAAVHRASLQLLHAGALHDARLASSFAGVHDPLERPGVGDWVAAEPDGDGTPLRVVSLEPRRAALVRRAAGERLEPQLLAANVDTALLFSAFPDDVNPRRLARLAALAYEGGATPVVVLSRADLADDVMLANAMRAVGSHLPGIPVLPVSARTDAGMAVLRDWLRPGSTLALLGPSGAGKSTLVNALAGGEVMATGTTSADGHGRHTTTHRALIALPGDVTVIDTPGLREVGMWAGTAASEYLFADITALALHCRFGDCTHDAEPGCAVREAVAAGTLSAERYEQWQQLQREARRAERTVQEQRRVERLGSRAIKRYDKDHRRD
jgi:ribosome biogenesis GTPase / thiamine phosphate phosphatase